MPTIAFTNVGTNSNTAGATVAVTVGAGGVPTGAVIVVGIVQGNNSNLSTGGTVADTAGNSYTQIAAHDCGTAGLGVNFGALFYAKNATALVNGNTITLTKQNSGVASAITVLYVTGCDMYAPLDTSVTAQNNSAGTGGSTSPTVTSGTPAVAGEGFVAFISSQDTNSAGLGFTQDTTHNWATPFTLQATPAATTAAQAAGGCQVNSGTSPIIFNPTFPHADRYWAIIVGFKPDFTIGWSTNPEVTVKRRPSQASDTAFVSTAYDVPVVGPSGIAWSQRFEEFKGKRKFSDPQAFGIPPVPAVGVQGVAWSQRLDYATPRKGRTDPQAIILRGVPAVGISGIAWSQRIDYAWPRKGRTDPAALDPKVTPAVGVSGIPWSQRFEPFYGRPITFTTPQGFAHRGVPAVGPSGIAWATRYEQVFYGPKAFTIPIGWAVSPEVIRLYPINRPRGAVPKWRFLG